MSLLNAAIVLLRGRCTFNVDDYEVFVLRGNG